MDWIYQWGISILKVVHERIFFHLFTLYPNLQLTNNFIFPQSFPLNIIFLYPWNFQENKMTGFPKVLFCREMFGLIEPIYKKSSNCKSLIDGQKQPPKVFFESCSQKFCNIQTKMPVLEFICNKVPILKINFNKCICFPWKFSLITEK